MTDAASRDSRASLLIAGLVGACAAAIALSQNLAFATALATPFAIAVTAWWTIQAPTRWLALFLFSALLLPPLPFAIGDTGPHLCLGFAALGLLAGVLRVRDWELRPDVLTGSLLLFFTVLLGSVSFAAFYSGAAVAAGSLARVILFAISVYVFFYTAHGPGRTGAQGGIRAVRWLFWLAVASAAFACLDFYFQFPAPAGYGPQFVWLDTGIYRRAQGVFYEASTLGNFCAFFLAMVAVALFRPARSSPVGRWALLSGGVVLSAALVFSYSRASLLNVLVAVAALLYLNRDRFRIRRLVAALLVCFAAGAAIAYTAFPSFVQSYWLRLWVSGQYFFSAANGILSGRLATWSVLGHFLVTHPWHALLGVGYKTLPYSDFIGQIEIADNMYLSLLVETGLVGLAAFVALNAAILRTAWKAMRAGEFFGTWMFCFWVGELAQMLSGDLFTYWRVLPVYFWVLAKVATTEVQRR